MAAEIYPTLAISKSTSSAEFFREFVTMQEDARSAECKTNTHIQALGLGELDEAQDAWEPPAAEVPRVALKV